MKRALVLLVASWLIAIHSLAQDISLDKKLGAENAAMVEQEMGIYHHDSLYQLVNAVGKKLVSRLKNNQFDFKFFLVDSEEPNAFALPGGYIYVTRGILPIINTEDELAGIMAHEIIHVMQRHSVKQMKKSTVTGLLTVPGNLINSVTGTNIGNVLNAPINLTTKAFISKYSRGHEAEADEFGIQLAASAGYKTSALADALLRLSKEIELISGSAERRSYFSDHPFTPNRISKIQSSASLYKPVNPNPVAQSQKQFIMNFGGLCFGPNPEQGIFIDNLFIHPDMKFAWSTPESWVTINKPSVVAAYTEKGDAIIAMRMMDDKKTIQELGEEAKAKSSEAKGITIQQAGDTIINSFPAYILRLKITEKDQVAISEMIWLNYHDQLVQLAGVGAYEFRSVMHQSLCSFRNAKYEDLQLVTFFELNIARAQENETLARLTERVNNRLNPEFTAVINDKSNEDILKRGDLVKIVTMKPYQPKR